MSLKKNGICGCKRKISLCKFWQKVLKIIELILIELIILEKNQEVEK